MNTNQEMIAGAIFKSNKFGMMVVLEYIDSRNVKIKFKETGFVTTAKASNIKSGIVKDRYLPTVYGVGFSGGDRKSEKENNVAYSYWHGAMQRCYDKRYHAKKPTYKECRVCSEWHNFQNFICWHNENYPSDGGVYQLDKDLLISGNKTYCPSACSYVTPKENAQTNAKEYKMMSPNGDVVSILNLSDFCADNGIDCSNALKVIKGKVKSCKGWTRAI